MTVFLLPFFPALLHYHPAFGAIPIFLGLLPLPNERERGRGEGGKK